MQDEKPCKDSRNHGNRFYTKAWKDQGEIRKYALMYVA